MRSPSPHGQQAFDDTAHQGGTAADATAPPVHDGVAPPPDWWGPSLRWPDSTGSQDGVRYANFAQARRLAIEVRGTVTIYDTLDHQIGSFSQQPLQAGALSFNSQYGLIDVTSLPVIAVAGVEPSASPPADPPPPMVPAAGRPPAHASSAQDIVATIERLAELHAKGVLDDAEFQAKKTELLGRI